MHTENNHEYLMVYGSGAWTQNEGEEKQFKQAPDHPSDAFRTHDLDVIIHRLALGARAPPRDDVGAHVRACPLPRVLL